MALGINNRGEVVGAYSLFSLTSASFLYQDGNYVPLGAPGDPNAYTQANAINNRGEIVGNVQISVRAPPHGWLNENGTISNYDVPGSGQTSLNGVNDYGDIVGWYYGDIIVNNSALSGVGSPGQYGFIEQNGQFYTFDVPNSSSTSLQGINDRDQLVGSYVDTAGTHSFFYAQGTLTQVARSETGTTWRVSLERLAAQLPLVQRYPSPFQRVLQPAHEMLVAAGALRDASFEQDGKAWFCEYSIGPRGS